MVHWKKFSSNNLSLLDRGFVYAIAHIRGGSEMGRYWYDQGKLLNKKNTFTDFIASAEHLIKERYTSKEKLAVPLATSVPGAEVMVVAGGSVSAPSLVAAQSNCVLTDEPW